MQCLARLTDFVKTKSEPIGTSKHRASVVKMCKRVTMDGSKLCKECFETPPDTKYRDGKYHGRNVHGLLTEPFPEDSHIYGSPWYLRVVKEFGEPETEWLKKAQAAQVEVDEFLGVKKEENIKPSVLEKKTEKAKPVQKEKTPEKEKKVQKQKPNQKKEVKEEIKKEVKEEPEVQKAMYVESEKPPITLPTDTIKLRKICLAEDVYALESEDGLMFSIGEDGGPDELIL
jgi:hypothetical protein